MIKDTDIDLTFDHRFGRPRFRQSYEDKAYDKLFKRNMQSSLWVDKYIKRSSLLPWNNRKLNTTKDLSKLRPKRSYGDWLSDDYGVTLRLTTDNTIMHLGDRIVHKEVMEEYFLETLGYLPYESLTFCMECSTRMITTLKNKNAWVPCRFHQTPRIPWEYRRINNGTGI